MPCLEASKAFYDSHLRRDFGEQLGCSLAAIAELERRLDGPFPAAYREFLGWIGEHYDGPFCGSDCFPEHLEANNRLLPELLAENGIAFQLPPRFLAFFTHQGYIAVWFALPATSDDPPVWIFNEGATPQPVEGPNFSTWLFDELRSIAEPPA
jgi:hypothetical protein